MRPRFLALLTTVFAGCMPAQETTAAGATLGYVFDTLHRSIRPILGTPGSALLGGGMALDTPLDRAVFSPRQDYALAVSGASWTVFPLAGEGVPRPGTALTGIAPDAMVAISSRGRAAVFYDRNAGTLHVVTGLPREAALSRTITAGADAAVAAIAVSDDGGTVLAALDKPHPAVVSFDESGNPRRLLELENPAALALSASGDAIVLDPRGGRVLLVRDVRGAAAVSTVAVAEDGISRPAGAALSPDGNFAYVANAEAANVVIFDLQQGSRSFVSCACNPQGVWKLNGDAVFRVTEFDGGPLWIMDASGLEPRVFFVPAAPDSPGDRNE